MPDLKKIISLCGFSEEMERYLIRYTLPETCVIDLILGAPIPLTQKRDLIESMYSTDSIKASEISSCILEIDEALKH